MIVNRDTTFTLLMVLNKYDEYTRKHSENVADLSFQIGKWLNLSSFELEEVYFSALFHDIGKIFIPVNLLNKKGNLSNKEYKLIKQHSNYGYEILKDLNISEEICRNVLYHHERYNGSGYPNGLSKKKIPLASRIIAIADSFDAMTGFRSYKENCSIEEAIFKIKQSSGILFDPYIINTFLKNVDLEESIINGIHISYPHIRPDLYFGFND